MHPMKKRRSDQVRVGDLVRMHKTHKVGIVTETFRSERLPRIVGKYELPPLQAVKVVFTDTGKIQCTVHTEIEVISE
jgi:hypothetical protein